MKAVRRAGLALSLMSMGATAMASSPAAHAQTAGTPVSGVMVLVTAKPRVTRDQIMAVMPAEVRQTVQLYLGGKVRQWYSRADGRGAVFLLDAKDVAEARAIMESLPLSQQSLVDDEYIAVSPLQPLGLLMAPR